MPAAATAGAAQASLPDPARISSGERSPLPRSGSYASPPAPVSAPPLSYLSARDRAIRPLSRFRAWLTRYNATVLAVLLLVIGVALAGHGISALTR